MSRGRRTSKWLVICRGRRRGKRVLVEVDVLEDRIAFIAHPAGVVLGDPAAVVPLVELAEAIDVSPVNITRVFGPPQLAVSAVTSVDDLFPATHLG